MTPVANAAAPVDRRAPEESGAPIDCVLFDLDGVVYHGPEPISGAVEGINFLHEQSIPVNYVTNNATRTAGVVAEHISTLGINTTPAEVTTSAQVLAGRLAERFGTGALIYLVGATGLATALESEGLTLTHNLDDGPVAIAQGLDPDITYQAIVRACEAITSGIEWWATNPDYSMVGPRSRVPGNGAFIDMLSKLTGAQPTVVGKPSPHMMEFAARRIGAQRPLMVGDRLDTDIEGGNSAGFETALVLTGVHDIHDALRARPGLRPTYILPSLRGLPKLIDGEDTYGSAGGALGSAGCRIVDGQLCLDDSAHSGAAIVQDALRLAWEAMDRGDNVAPGNLPRRIHD
ncbi:HAD-IIA family hydrolase [Brevibacterium aurantiacum]|uniref:HAD-IIA family hydrolase n=1 Tax=Brevibacterium aurantiacum TaxID=273384 RepID=A0A556C895_BREAU|nr:HAD-IIA family hydrolase [Brevibacterium aurantiacum]TSI13672.1 HAD-IIA family hydrolase [Brevibacterium aurantiacum]